MRLFVALEIPEPLRQEIARLKDRIEGGLPRARWVLPERMHLTLVFLGKTDEALLPALRDGLASVFSGQSPIQAQVRGAGTFPPDRPARVAWLGLEGGPELLALQAGVAAVAVEVAGLEPERRPFHPHLTLARPARPWPRVAVERFLAAADRSYGEPFEISRGVLMESHLGAGGPRYEPVATFPLEGRPA